MGGGAEGEGEIMDENRRRKGYWAGRCSGRGEAEVAGLSLVSLLMICPNLSPH